MTANVPDSPEAALRVMRLIGFALISGVAIFAAVAWFIQQGQPATASPEPTLLYVWIAVATSLAAAAMVVWRGQVVPYLDGRSAADWRERASRIQTGVVITWAIVEAGALFGVVVYFIEGHVVAGLGGVLLMAAAVGLSWPRAEWLEPAGRPT